MQGFANLCMFVIPWIYAPVASKLRASPFKQSRHDGAFHLMELHKHAQWFVQSLHALIFICHFITIIYYVHFLVLLTYSCEASYNNLNKRECGENIVKFRLDAAVNAVVRQIQTDASLADGIAP